MRTYSIPRNIWRAIYPALIFFSIQIIVVFVAAICAAVVDIVMYGTALEGQAILWLADNALFLALISGILCLAPFLPIWFKTQKTLTPYTTRNTALIFAVSFFAFAGLNITISFLFEITDVVRFFPSYAELSEVFRSGNLIIRFMVIVIAAPIVEELCCRGIILNRLLTWTRTWVAVLIQAALFGIMHFNIFQGLYAFAVGVAIGFLYTRFRKLWLCIVAHLAFNLVAFVLIVMQQLDIDVHLFAIISGIIICIACGVWLFKLPAAQVKELT